jgi:hypothetical protein
MYPSPAQASSTKRAFKNSPGLKVFAPLEAARRIVFQSLMHLWVFKNVSTIFAGEHACGKILPAPARSRRITDFCGRRLALAILVKPPLRNFKLS